MAADGGGLPMGRSLTHPRLRRLPVAEPVWRRDGMLADTGEHRLGCAIADGVETGCSHDGHASPPDHRDPGSSGTSPDHAQPQPEIQASLAACRMTNWRDSPKPTIITGVGPLGAPLRQASALAAITLRLTSMPDVLGALLVGDRPSRIRSRSSASSRPGLQ
jgi:hypothetical protein